MSSNLQDSSEVISSSRPKPPFDLYTLLDKGSGIIKNLDEVSAECDKLDALRDRLATGRFHLAVLGQFKRGKSTFLNALLGEAILPTSAIPLTAIPTFILPGNERHVNVSYADTRPPDQCVTGKAEDAAEFLRRYVTEEGNPKNRLGVDQVEVRHPAAILRRGVVLIDTPGIGSTFRHNTEATLNFLPQCDAALFMVSADPPLTEVEVEFLKQVRSKIPRLFFILNKIDYLAGDEQGEVLTFFRKVLREQAGIMDDATIFPISARLGLDARKRGDDGLWTRSGLAEVERYLTDFLADEKMAVMREAISRKAGDILADVLMRVRLAVRSLQMPIEDIEERLKIFELKLAEIERERCAAVDLLAGDKKRILGFLEEHAGWIKGKARVYLEGMIKETMAKSPPEEVSEEPIRDALAAAIPGYFEHALGQAVEVFKKRLDDTLAPHQRRAHALIESIRRNAAELFDVPYYAPEDARVLEVAQEPYWITYKWDATIFPVPEKLIDRLVSEEKRRRRIMNRLMQQVDALLVRNVENVRWPMYQSLNQAFLSFGSDLDQRLAETTAATHGAIKAAMKKRSEHAEAAEETVLRAETTLNALEEIRAALEHSITA